MRRVQLDLSPKSVPIPTSTQCALLGRERGEWGWVGDGGGTLQKRRRSGGPERLSPDENRHAGSAPTGATSKTVSSFTS